MFTNILFQLRLFLFMAGCFLFATSVQAQQPAAKKPAGDTASSKAINKALDDLLQEEMEFFNLVNKYPDAKDFLHPAPDPEVFRKDFAAFLPTGLQKMQIIVEDHMEDDDDSITSYPLEGKALPGTFDNHYEYSTDGMLQFDATFRASIDTGINKASAIKLSADWKLLLTKAFPEEAVKIEDKTDGMGNQFITLNHPKSIQAKSGSTGYTTLPGWSITLQKVMDGPTWYVCLVLAPLKK